MSIRQAIRTGDAPRPAGSYSQAVVGGGFVFVSGQGPFDPSTGEIVGSTISEQTHQTLQNVTNILQQAGCGLKDVVRVSAYLASFELFAEYDRAYGEHFDEPPPARITAAADLGGILVEIEVMALAASP